MLYHFLRFVVASFVPAWAKTYRKVVLKTDRRYRPAFKATWYRSLNGLA